MTKLGDVQIAFFYKGTERQKTFVTVKNIAGEILVKTSVKRAKDDAYDKVVGRFYAFRKAMNQLTAENLATKQQRAEAWRLFKEKVNLPKGVNLNRERRIVRQLIPATV